MPRMLYLDRRWGKTHEAPVQEMPIANFWGMVSHAIDFLTYVTMAPTRWETNQTFILATAD